MPPEPARRGADPAVLAEVRERLAADVASGAVAAEEPLAPGRVAEALARAGRPLGTRALLDVVDALRAELTGAGPLEPLLGDPAVTDVCVSPGPAGPRVWVDRGSGLEESAVDVGGEVDVRTLALRLAARAGSRLDAAAPWVDGRLPGGVRLHAVLPPLSPAGTCLSLRVARPAVSSLGALVEAGALTAGAADLLRRLVRARVAFLVSGGTGAGKTTLLGALLGEVDPRERVVLVEDVGELQPALPHVVRLEARRANVEGVGEVGLDVLVRQALRMRPDRLVVGECRGPEVRDLLAALNTGHEGGAGTVHANAPEDLPARLEALGALAGMDAAAVAAQAAAAVGAVVHVARSATGTRRVSSVAVVHREPGGPLTALTALDAAGAGPGWPALARRCGWTAPPPPWLGAGEPCGAASGVPSARARGGTTC